MPRDWTGSSTTAFHIIGASNHSETEREEHDFYATDPYAIDCLLSVAKPYRLIWECACGEGHLAKRLEAFGYEVVSTDLVDRGFGRGGGGLFGIFRAVQR